MRETGELAKALECLESLQSRPLARLRYRIGIVLNDLGEYSRALEHLNAEVLNAERHGDPEYRSAALAERARAEYGLCRHDDAGKSGSEALAIAQQIGANMVAGRAHHVLGMIASAAGNDAAALEHFAAAINLQTQMEHRPAEARTRHSLAELHSARGRTSEAINEYQNALTLFEHIGNAPAVRDITDVLEKLKRNED